MGSTDELCDFWEFILCFSSDTDTELAFWSRILSLTVSTLPHNFARYPRQRWHQHWLMQYLYELHSSPCSILVSAVLCTASMLLISWSLHHGGTMQRAVTLRVDQHNLEWLARPWHEYASGRACLTSLHISNIISRIWLTIIGALSDTMLCEVNVENMRSKLMFASFLVTGKWRRRPTHSAELDVPQAKGCHWQREEVMWWKWDWQLLPTGHLPTLA